MAQDPKSVYLKDEKYIHLENTPTRTYLGWYPTCSHILYNKRRGKNVREINWLHTMPLHGHYDILLIYGNSSLIARFMGPTWGPSGADRTQVGPMLAPWTLLSGILRRVVPLTYAYIVIHMGLIIASIILTSSNQDVSAKCTWGKFRTTTVL